jgi:hypothetical protein
MTSPSAGASTPPPWTMVGEFDGVPYSAEGMSIVKFRPWSRQTYYSRDYYSEGDVMTSIPGLDEAIGGFRYFYRCAVDPNFDCPDLPPMGAKPGGESLQLEKSDSLLPADSFSLQQNYPNPFNPTTKISFVVPGEGGNVSLRILDVSGKLVRTLVDGFEPAGIRSVNWSGQDDQGRPVSSGTYFYQLTAPGFSEMKKMVLLK